MRKKAQSRSKRAAVKEARSRKRPARAISPKELAGILPVNGQAKEEHFGAGTILDRRWTQLL